MARKLWVGPHESFKTLASAVNASKSGDTIYMKPGEYVNDFAVIRHDLTIVGTGDGAHLKAKGMIPNGKAILVTRADVTIENVEFSGAKVKDGNGAGIRYVDGDLVLRDTFFHHNQNGVMGGTAKNGTIRIEDSEFAFNGTGTGKTHNLYVGKIKHLSVDDSHFHDVKVGHNLKSRAEKTTVTDSTFEDGAKGSASYAIDLPNGGIVNLSGNTIHKGPHAQNIDLVSYGAEGKLHAVNSVMLRDNDFINDYEGRPITGFRNYTKAEVKADGNDFSDVKKHFVGKVKEITSRDVDHGDDAPAKHEPSVKKAAEKPAPTKQQPEKHDDDDAPVKKATDKPTPAKQQPQKDADDTPVKKVADKPADKPAPKHDDDDDHGPAPVAKPKAEVAVDHDVLAAFGKKFFMQVEIVNTSKVAIANPHVVIDQDASVDNAWNGEFLRARGGDLHFDGHGAADVLAPGESWTFVYNGSGDADIDDIDVVSGGKTVAETSDWMF